MNHGHERALGDESQRLQMDILQPKRGRWLTEDWMFFWATVAVIEGIALAVAFVMLCRAYEVKPRTAYEGFEPSGGSRGVGAVQVRVRADVAAADAALRGDSVPVPAARVVVAPEARWAVGGVSTSGHMAGHGAGVGECGLSHHGRHKAHGKNFGGSGVEASCKSAPRFPERAEAMRHAACGIGQCNTERMELAAAERSAAPSGHRAVTQHCRRSSDRPAFALFKGFPLRWNAAEGTDAGRDAGMDAGNGAVAAGLAAAPIPEGRVRA